MRSKKYLVLLVDRKRARMFSLHNGNAVNHLELSHDEAPPNVKKGENTWDAQDKIFRHIEDHLRKHLEHVANGVAEFAKKEGITDILIGGHKPLFNKIEGHLKYPFSKKVRGSFVTELKIPQEEVLKRVKKLIDRLEVKETEERLQKALS